MSFGEPPQWRWNWTDMCGPGGLNVWSPLRHDFGLCFQSLFFHIPTLTCLACVSMYHVGRQSAKVRRGALRQFAIVIRSLVALTMAVLPLIRIYKHINQSDEHIKIVSYFLFAVQGITWLCHFWFLLTLRSRLGLSPRGPMSVCILWTLLAAMSCVTLRSYSLLSMQTTKYSIELAYKFSVCELILHILYAITMIPSMGSSSVVYHNRPLQRRHETEPLLSNAYVRFDEEDDPTYLGVAMDGASWLEHLLFRWVQPLMEKGARGKLEHSEDLYDLPVAMSSEIVGNKLSKALIGDIDKEIRRTRQEVKFLPRPTVPLVWALHRCFWRQFYSVGILRFIADVCGFCGPIILNRLIAHIEGSEKHIEYAYLYAIALVVTTLIAALSDSHFNFAIALVGLRMRTSLVSVIYRKTLRVSGPMLNAHFSLGEIVNFMSTDTDRIVNSCPAFHALWSIPFQLAVTLYLLHQQVGIAFLAGVVFSIILIPINKCIATRIGVLSERLMHEKDGRVKLMSEILRGIKAIKLYVWEQHFTRLVTKIRDSELKYLRGRKYLDALCVYFWATTPVIVSILTFGTYVLLNNKLTAATVFTTMALLNMLITPLNAFPWVLNGLTEAWVSLQRIQRFLDLAEVSEEELYQRSLSETNYDIILRQSTFSWFKNMSGDEKARLHGPVEPFSTRKGKQKKVRIRDDDFFRDDSFAFKLNDLNVRIKQGNFVGVIGVVGSGKSSLLLALAGELAKEAGAVWLSDVDAGIGLVTQQSWLQRTTIRDNILFGGGYDEERYHDVLYACGLVGDLKAMPAGDLTGVGEGGVTLSGGQRARISLARAIYQDKHIYLLDDIFAAVDTRMARHIYQYCIMGLLKERTRILCTHHIQYLVKADCILLMENGAIRKQGKPIDVISTISDTLPIDMELDMTDSAHCSTSSSEIEASGVTEASFEGDADSMLQAEEQSKGALDKGVICGYWKSVGWWLSFAILSSITLMQMSKNLSDWWLSHWVSTAAQNGSANLSHLFMQNDWQEVSSDISGYLHVYLELAAFNSIFTLLRAFVFAYGGIKAAEQIHKNLLRTVMRASSQFFDTTPLGRILNRFSSDVYTVDDSLPFIANILLAQFFGLIGTIAITVYGLPWVCLVLLPLVPVYHWLQRNYRCVSRELKRISSSTLSPIYSHFNETIQGLSVLRTMRAQMRFKRENEDYVDVNIKAQLAGQAATRWLGVRLQFIGVAMVAGVSFVAVIQHQYDIADAGLIGLALSYALTVTGSLGGVINAFTETERELVSVERILQYTKATQQETLHFTLEPPFGWPSHGAVTFHNVTLKYREHAIMALKNVSFETRPCEKIGVVGRTGSGKSTLITALFRLAEIESGVITIDSVDISMVALPTLRARMFCIPQDPFLFSGSLRENLDPLEEFNEHELWSALGKVNLTEHIRKAGGLDKKTDGVAGGLNLSLGQKQLVCLARAILHNAKILCLDEATANVDPETDRQIQRTLKTSFGQCTVITIAHRIQSIIDSDRVIVMSDGRIVEFDTPNVLLCTADSYFSILLNQGY